MSAHPILSKLLSHGLTQMEIHRRSGIPQSTISHLHTGRRGKRPSYDVIVKLEKLLRDISTASASFTDVSSLGEGANEHHPCD
ncbi:helix-turn-helix domain-containing protein [Paraburkholderia hayleyella]|uniref:helix-turn-helix domain-containing protein n=1 Tax=Paraburkholderia hayleyella TaxID=2152889 RepID=UPI0012909914